MLIMKTVLCCLVIILQTVQSFDPEKDVWGDTTAEEVEEYYQKL